MNDSREPVPEDVKRELRQEAGFGCVVCGYPIYDYHHIIEHAKDPHMRPQDMMIVCPNHHRLMPKLSEAKQRKHKTNPYNKTKGYVNGQLVIDQSELIVQVATVVFANRGLVLTIDNEPLLSLKLDDGDKLLVSTTLYDKNDNTILLIQDNEWISGDKNIWDLTFGFNWIRILKKSRDVSLYLDARTEIIKMTGTFWKNGYHFKADKKGIFLGGLKNILGFSDLAFIGAYLNINTELSFGEVAKDHEACMWHLLSNYTVESIIEEYKNFRRTGYVL